MNPFRTTDAAQLSLASVGKSMPPTTTLDSHQFCTSRDRLPDMSQLELERLFAPILFAGVTGEKLLDQYYFANHLDRGQTLENAIAFHQHNQTRVLVVSSSEVGLNIAEYFRGIWHTSVCLGEQGTVQVANLPQCLHADVADFHLSAHIDNQQLVANYADVVYRARDALGRLDVVFIEGYDPAVPDEERAMDAPNPQSVEPLVHGVSRRIMLSQLSLLTAALAAVDAGAKYVFLAGSDCGGRWEKWSQLAKGMGMAAVERLAEAFPNEVMGVSISSNCVLTPATALRISDASRRNSGMRSVTPAQFAQAIAWLSAYWRPDLFGAYYQTISSSGEVQFNSRRFVNDAQHCVEMPGDYAARALSGEALPRFPEQLETALHVPSTDRNESETLPDAINLGVTKPREAKFSEFRDRVHHQNPLYERKAYLRHAWNSGVRNDYELGDLRELSRQRKLRLLIEGKSQDDLEKIFMPILRPDISGEQTLDEYHFIKHFDATATIDNAREYHAKHQSKILVLGAGGVGLAVAKAFAAIPGVKLAVSARSESSARRLKEALGSFAVAQFEIVQMPDVQGESKISQAVLQAKNILGGIDQLIIGIGTTTSRDTLLAEKPLDRSGIAERASRMQQVIEINEIYSLAAAITAVSTGVKKVFLPGSVHGEHLQNKHVVSYGMTKAALRRLAEGLPKGTFGICWNGDYILSPMTAEVALAVLDSTKAGFFLTPRQVAEAILWLSVHWEPEFLEGYSTAPYGNQRRTPSNVRIPGENAALYLQGKSVSKISTGLADAADTLLNKYPLTCGNLFCSKKVIRPQDLIRTAGLWEGAPLDDDSRRQHGKFLIAKVVSAFLGNPLDDSGLGCRVSNPVYLSQSLEFLCDDWIDRADDQTIEVRGEILESCQHSGQRNKAFVAVRTDVIDANNVRIATGIARLLVGTDAEQWSRLSRTRNDIDDNLRVDQRPLLDGIVSSSALLKLPLMLSHASAAQSTSTERRQIRKKSVASWKRLSGEILGADFDFNVTIGGTGLRTPIRGYSNQDLAELASVHRNDLLARGRQSGVGRSNYLVDPYDDGRHYNCQRFEKLNTGIKWRYWLSEADSLGRLAAEATIEALEQTLTPLPPSILKLPDVMEHLRPSISAVATHGGDAIAPGLGVEVNQQLGLGIGVPTITSQVYCAGTIGAIYEKLPHIACGFSNLAIIPIGEVYSRHLRPDQPSWPIFGDLAAACTLVRAREGFGIHWLINQTNSSCHTFQDAEWGSSDMPLGEIMRTSRDGYFDFKGREVGVMAAEAIVFLVTRARDFIRSGLHQLGHTDPDRIDWYVFHQANQGLILDVTDSLKIPRDKILWTIDRYGNTSAASSTSVLHDFRDRIQEGHLIFRADFGGAFSRGAMLITWGGSALLQNLQSASSNRVTALASLEESLPAASEFRWSLPIGSIVSDASHIPPFMRVFGLRKGFHGPPATALVETIRPVPEIGEHDVLVQVMAASLNFNASWAALGRPVSTFSLARVKHQDVQVLGSDAAGIVMKVGRQVTDVCVGDHVVMATGEDDRDEDDHESGDSMQKRSFHITGYENPHGTFAQFVRLDERQVLPKPLELSWEAASSYMLVGATAWRALKYRVCVSDGDTVLVWGGSKGTGAYAVQIARFLGARNVVAVVSSDYGAKLAKSYGATATIDRRELPKAIWGEVPTDPNLRALWAENAELFVQQFVAKTGGQLADVVVEHPGAHTYPLSFAVLKNSGRVTHYAGTTGYKFTFCGKEIEQSPNEILDNAGLAAGSNVVVYGADDVAHNVIQLIRRADARVVCVVNGHQDVSTVESWNLGKSTLAGIVNLDTLQRPCEMPTPPHPDLSCTDQTDYEDYRTNTLNVFRSEVRRRFQGAFPDIIVERAHHTNTLDMSVFTVKPHGTVAFVESTKGYRYAFDARFVWMFQKRILPWIIGTHFANHDQTKEFNRLVMDGKIKVPNVEVFPWSELPRVQQRMLEGSLTEAKTSVLVGKQGTAQTESMRGEQFASEEAFPPIIYRASRPVRLSDRHVREMILLSGDQNPIHQCDVVAREANFEGRIAHGMLVGGLIPKFLGELGWLRLASLDQLDYSFVRPVYVTSRDKLRVTLEVRGIQLKGAGVQVNVRSVVEKRFEKSGRWEEVLVGTVMLKAPRENLQGLQELMRVFATGESTMSGSTSG